MAFSYGLFRDYIYVSIPTFGANPTDVEIDAAMRQRATSIQQDHPPKTIDYWESRLYNVKPKMTSDALFKYVPSVGPSYSLLRSDGNQTYYYAVDSKFGVACIMTTTGQRVVNPIGVFEHFTSLDEFGGIEMEHVPELRKLLQEQ